MARTRTISQSLALLTGPTPSTGAHGSTLTPFWALQSLSWDWSNPKEDISVYGKGAPIGRETINPPEVNLNCSYYITSNLNEINNLEFDQSGTASVLTSLLTGGDKNYFIFVSPDGTDAIGSSGATSGCRVYGIGNCFLNSYSIEAAVGGFPTATVSVQGLNVRTYTGGVSQNIPAVNPTTGLEVTGVTFTVPTITSALDAYGADNVSRTVIKPGDISVTLSNAGGIFMDYTTTCVQSINLSFDLNRIPQNCLGSKFTTSRDIQFPINVNFEAEMLAKDVVTGSLAEYLCNTGGYSAEVRMRLPICGTGVGETALGFKLLNISMESQSWNTSVGGEPQTVTTTWIGQIGGSGDTTNNLYMSGTFD